MIVARIHMWPKGERALSRLLSTAALDLTGVALRDDATLGVVRGERAYRVRVFKDAEFGGPGEDTDLSTAPVWRSGHVRGHLPGVGRRGTWDLLTGALGVLLSGRLDRYVATCPVHEHHSETQSISTLTAVNLRELAAQPDRPAAQREWLLQAASYVEAISP